MPLEDPFSGYPTVISLPVQWGDQDAFQHVNNTVYFRWCESARIAYLDQVVLSDLMDREKVGPILAAISCNYRRPVTFPDTIRCGARVTRLGRASLTMEHVIYSEDQQKVVADAQSTLVIFDYEQQASRSIHDDIRRTIEEIEGRTLS